METKTFEKYETVNFEELAELVGGNTAYDAGKVVGKVGQIAAVIAAFF